MVSETLTQYNPIRTNPQTFVKCGKCEGTLFERVEATMLTSSGEVNQGVHIEAVKTSMWKCVVCNTFIDAIRSTQRGQQASIRRELVKRIPDDQKALPSTTIEDLNEIVGRKRQLLSRPGGLN